MERPIVHGGPPPAAPTLVSESTRVLPKPPENKNTIGRDFEAIVRDCDTAYKPALNAPGGRADLNQTGFANPCPVQPQSTSLANTLREPPLRPLGIDCVVEDRGAQHEPQVLSFDTDRIISIQRDLEYLDVQLGGTTRDDRFNTATCNQGLHGPTLGSGTLANRRLPGAAADHLMPGASQEVEDVTTGREARHDSADVALAVRRDLEYLDFKLHGLRPDESIDRAKCALGLLNRTLDRGALADRRLPGANQKWDGRATGSSRAFQYFDRDGDGYIDEDEFEIGQLRMKAEQALQNLDRLADSVLASVTGSPARERADEVNMCVAPMSCTWPLKDRGDSHAKPEPLRCAASTSTTASDQTSGYGDFSPPRSHRAGGGATDPFGRRCGAAGRSTSPQGDGQKRNLSLVVPRSSWGDPSVGRNRAGRTPGRRRPDGVYTPRVKWEDTLRQPCQEASPWLPARQPACSHGPLAGSPRPASHAAAGGSSQAGPRHEWRRGCSPAPAAPRWRRPCCRHSSPTSRGGGLPAEAPLHFQPRLWESYAESTSRLTDRNGDGRLHRGDFEHGATVLRRSDDIFHCLDRNGDGVIDQNEFRAGCLARDQESERSASARSQNPRAEVREFLNQASLAKMLTLGTHGPQASSAAAAAQGGGTGRRDQIRPGCNAWGGPQQGRLLTAAGAPLRGSMDRSEPGGFRP